MAQHASSERLPPRDAKLGRPLGERRASHGVLLLLPGGEPRSARRPSPIAAAAALRMARGLARAGMEESLTAHVLRYRYRGWNDEAAHPAEDAEWAVQEVVRRYGDVPVCLIGTDLGARAALRAGGHEAVVAVLAIAPWLTGAREPVEQLVGRHVLFVQGADDAHSDPEHSYRLAERAKAVNPDVCRFEVHSDGHALHGHRREVAALAQDFAFGAVCERDFARPLADALAAPPPLGLRMPLAAGFGRSLGR
ncbi:alpha/beta hydrolase family protein [Streptomyces oceani]|uniref:Dienelactone hydrolase n=1 Tax=Streptomyces oceani TaxID=1075402 RepID=A0A1E7KIN8_9ACTN|nr:alpha/beta hydrolase [Streptomyces oceani]OEV03714.1 dienelactone hydrolase [Streptomyces oceani]